MLIETGVVVRVEANAVWVKTRRSSVCGNCQSRQGCGQNLLQRLVSTDADIKARLDQNMPAAHLVSGDEVEIGIEEGALIMASVLAYGLPLIGLILCVVAAESWAVAEPIQLLSGALGLAVGLSLSRLVLFSRFKPSYFEPLVVRNLDFSPSTSART